MLLVGSQAGRALQKCPQSFAAKGSHAVTRGEMRLFVVETASAASSSVTSQSLALANCGKRSIFRGGESNLALDAHVEADV